QGWQLAQTTLSFERGGDVLARVVRAHGNLSRLIEVCRTLPRDGRTALDDPLVRQKLGRMLVEIEVMRYGALRVLARLERGERPGPEASIDKLTYSELDKRHQELVQEILGPFGQLESGVAPELALSDDAGGGLDASWPYNFLWSRAGTIYAG